VLSFGDFFFAQAKKSHSLAAASETKGRADSLPDDRFWYAPKQIPRLRLGMTKNGSNAINPIFSGEKAGRDQAEADHGPASQSTRSTRNTAPSAVLVKRNR
jgi:hypothetical protein